jgi:hypothetical protein
MLDSLLTQNTVTNHGVASESARLSGNAFEAGADSDFQRILDNAEATRQEYRREDRRRSEDRASERRRAEGREAAKRKEGAGPQRIQSPKEGSPEGGAASFAGTEAQVAEEEAFGAAAAAAEAEADTFKPQRPRGRTLAFAALRADMSFPGGFKRSVSHAMILKGDSEGGMNGLMLGTGESPVSVLKGTLEALGTSPNLASLGGETLGEVQNLMLASGVSPEECRELLDGIQSEDGSIAMLDLLKVLSQADDWLKVNGVTGGSEQLVATEEGLNSLGQFLLGLGLSIETVKQVTSQMEIGAIIQSSTLAEIVGSGGAEAMQRPLGEGDLNFLALALQSMGASLDSLNKLGLLLEESGGQLNLGGLMDFLKTLETPRTAQNLTQLASSIQDIALSVSSEQELTKAPVFNEILMKLSLLGDQRLDRDFFELSPALQALRGGLSGMRNDVSSGGDFNQDGGKGGEDRRERESRRMTAAGGAGGGPGTLSGAFAGSLYDGVAGYSGQESLARQLSQRIAYGARNGVRRLKMSLAPESLGELSIELKVSGNKITANIQAESLEAYRALEGEVMALRESLAAEGLELSLTLGFAGEGGKFFADDGTWRPLEAGIPGEGGEGGEESSPDYAADQGYATGGSLLDTLV